MPYHPAIAELCIKYRKHLIKPSYISPAMKALHEKFGLSSTRLSSHLNRNFSERKQRTFSSMKSDLILVSTTVPQFRFSQLYVHKINVSSLLLRSAVVCQCPRTQMCPWGYKFSWSPRVVLATATAWCYVECRTFQAEWNREIDIAGIGRLLIDAF